MKFRPQRGSLVESMTAAITIPPTRLAIARAIGEPIRAIQCSRYDNGSADTRIGWAQTYLITAWGRAIGFTDEEAL